MLKLGADRTANAAAGVPSTADLWAFIRRPAVSSRMAPVTNETFLPLMNATAAFLEARPEFRNAITTFAENEAEHLPPQ